MFYYIIWYWLSSDNDCNEWDNWLSVWLFILFDDYMIWHLYIAAVPHDLEWVTGIFDINILSIQTAMKFCTVIFPRVWTILTRWDRCEMWDNLTTILNDFSFKETNRMTCNNVGDLLGNTLTIFLAKSWIRRLMPLQHICRAKLKGYWATQRRY